MMSKFGIKLISKLSIHAKKSPAPLPRSDSKTKNKLYFDGAKGQKVGSPPLMAKLA